MTLPEIRGASGGQEQDPDVSKIKGIVLQALRQFGETRQHPLAYAKALAALPEPSRAALGTVILATTWYPIKPYQQLLNGVVAELGGDPAALGVEFGRFMLQHNLNRIYRFALGFLSPEFIMRRAPMLWKMYYDDERLELLEVGATRLVARVHGVVPISAPYCSSVLGGMLETVAQSGGKGTTGAERRCRRSGAAACEYAIEWK